MSFIDLDGVHAGTRPAPAGRASSATPPKRPSRTARLVVPVSAHAVDSVNLKDPQLGVYETCAELVAQHGVTKGRIRSSLAPGERHAGLTVNEYETLLMRHDLSRSAARSAAVHGGKGRSHARQPARDSGQDARLREVRPGPRLQPARRRARARASRWSRACCRGPLRCRRHASSA